MRWLFIALASLALAGCVTEQGPALPMTLAPTETAKAACLTYGDTPTFGECKPQTAAQGQ